MNYKELAKTAKMLKETEGGKEKMCAITEKWYNDGRKEGITVGKAEGIAVGEARGEARGKAEGFNIVAENMIRENMSAKLISKLTNLSIPKLRAISEQIGVALVM